MFGSTVTPSQGHSLASALETAGLRHGDKANVVLMGVGAESDDCGNVKLHFCPVSARIVPDTLQPASSEMRKQDMPVDVALSRASRKAIRAGLPRQTRGFVALHCTIVSNGHLHISEAIPGKHEVAELPFRIATRGAYEVFCASAR